MSGLVCVAGKNRIAVETLNIIRALNTIDVVAVCNRSDDGQDRWQPSYKRFANETGVETLELSQLYDFEGLILLSTEFDRIIQLDRFRSDARLYNVHFSALPAYKGMYTSAHPILRGERESGCTLHEIAWGIDTGPIIDQTTFPIASNETAKSLYGKYLDRGRDLIQANVLNLLAGSIEATPQPVAGSSYFSPASINYKALTVDLRQTCESIIKQIRAYNHRAFQLPIVHGHCISAGFPMSTPSRKAPGTVISMSATAIVIATIDFDCRLVFDRFDELLTAIRFDDLATMNTILFNDPALLNESNNQGWTPLIVASFHNSRQSIARLIHLGADPNKPNEKGTTPLMYAKNALLRTKDPSSIVKLLEAGASAGARDIWGKTLFHYVHGEYETTIRNLVEVHSKIREQSPAQETSWQV